MTDGIKNMEASVRARLGNIARKEKINFDLVLLLFMQERFVLKGGLLILSSTNIKTRPTKDIDFLAKHISNDVEEIKNAFMKICMIEVNDGVNFDLESLTVERITEA